MTTTTTTRVEDSGMEYHSTVDTNDHTEKKKKPLDLVAEAASDGLPHGISDNEGCDR